MNKNIILRFGEILIGYLDYFELEKLKCKFSNNLLRIQRHFDRSECPLLVLKAIFYTPFYPVLFLL